MPPAYTAGPGQSWKAEAAPPPVRRPRAGGPVRFHAVRRVLSAALFFTACAGLVWLVTWWTRPKPVRAVVLAAGYEANLAVPHNSYGRRWADALADGPAAEFRKDTRWDAGLRGGRPRAVLVAFAAHGGSDAAGPYLLPTDAAPGPAADNRLRLTVVLDRLATLPAATEKVLVLEAGGMPADPLFGPPESDFARGLESLDILAVPNLSVLTANGPGERAWPAEAHGTTAFGHFLRAGLAGAADADADGRVTLWELHGYVAPRVEEWAARTRAAVQTPRLHPPGPEGERRARAVVLARPPGPPPADESLPPFAPPAGLRPAWDRHAAREGQMPSPASYAPHLWRVYGATLARAEALALACDPAVSDLLARAAELEAQLDSARRVEVGDPDLAAGVFGAVAPDPTAKANIDKLWSAPPDDAAKLAGQLAPTAAVYDALLDRAAADPARQLPRAAELVRLLDRPGRVRPAAAHLLVMLAAKLPPGTLSGRTDLIRTALAVRRLSDTAAAAGADGYADRVAPRLADRLAKADAERAGCEDRLFATDPGRAAADYATVTAAYQAILSDAGRWRAAFATRDRLFAELPALAAWADRQPAATAEPADQVRRLWVAAHRLDQTLDGPADIADVAVAAADLARQLDGERANAVRPVRAMLPAPPAGLSPLDGRDAVERVLPLPLPPDVRAQLWPLLDRFHREASAAAAREAKADDGTAARRRAALAAAALGRGEERPAYARVPLLPDEVRRLLDTDPTDDPTSLRTAFREADRLARITPAALPPFRPEPAVVLRGLLAQELALALADRHAGLLWAGDAPTDEPYYRQAANRLLTDVAALGSTDAVRPRLAAVRGRLAVPFRPALVGGPAVATADPTPVRLEVAIDGGRADAVPGFLTVWADPPAGLALVGPADRRAVAWPGTARYAVAVTDTPGAGNRATAVTVRGLFRGWELSGKADLSLYPVPDAVATVDAPPPRAAVGVRASADAVRRFGCGDGAVAVVIDCSGSMAAGAGRPAAESRYLQGVAAAGKILAGLPRDTVFSVWVFGQAGEGTKTIAAAEQTIARVAGPVRRDPDDAEQLSAIAGKLAKLEPFNESPITRAVLTARDDLLSAAGYRAVVLVSDGQDNREPDGPAFPTMLRTRYRAERVALHVVGFPPQTPDEETAADRIRDAVRGLPVPGTYTVAPDVDGVIAALRAGLSPRLTARLVPTAGGDPIELAVAPGGTADRQAAAPPGRYELATAPVSGGTPVGLAGGDRLLLGLDVAPGGRPAFRRLTLADEYPSRPFARGDGGWRATVLRNRRQGTGLTLHVGLETTDPAARIVRPADVWFELAADLPGSPRPAVRWRPVYDQPAPVWELVAPVWPIDPGGGPARPIVRVWYEPTGSAAAVAAVSLGAVLDAAGPIAARVGADEVTVERTAADPGTLALRVRHPADRPVLVRLDGAEVVWSEQRVYGKAGQSAGLFRLADTADPRAARVALVPLAGFRAAARRIELIDLPAPDADDAPGR